MPTNWSEEVQVADVRCRPPSKLALASRLTPSMPPPICVLGLHAIFRFGEGVGTRCKIVAGLGDTRYPPARSHLVILASKPPS